MHEDMNMFYIDDYNFIVKKVLSKQICEDGKVKIHTVYEKELNGYDVEYIEECEIVHPDDLIEIDMDKMKEGQEFIETHSKNDIYGLYCCIKEVIDYLKWGLNAEIISTLKSSKDKVVELFNDKKWYSEEFIKEKAADNFLNEYVFNEENMHSEYFVKDTFEDEINDSLNYFYATLGKENILKYYVIYLSDRDAFYKIMKTIIIRNVMINLSKSVCTKQKVSQKIDEYKKNTPQCLKEKVEKLCALNQFVNENKAKNLVLEFEINGEYGDKIIDCCTIEKFILTNDEKIIIDEIWNKRPESYFQEEKLSQIVSVKWKNKILFQREGR